VTDHTGTVDDRRQIGRTTLRSLTRRRLEGTTWRHEAGPFAALRFSFRLRSTDPIIGTYLERVLASLRGPGTERDAAEHTYSIFERTESARRRFAVYCDDERVGAGVSPAKAVALVLWHVNQRAVSDTSDLVLVHASAARYDDFAFVFPAAMESGKTTLVAGLIERGMGYLTDEAAAVDPGTLEIVPYPKPLAIDPGSWSTLASLTPDPADGFGHLRSEQWHVDPRAISPGSLAARCAPRFIVSPRYEATGPTALEPLARSQALVVLVEQAMNLGAHGRSGFLALARMVEVCDAYRLRISDLDAACRLVFDLAARAPTPARSEQHV
jgi:hypothetical protein